MHANHDVKATIQSWTQEAGFDACGFTSASAIDGGAEAMAGFVSMGFHGDMAWMVERAHQRAALDVLWPEAKSAIICVMNYGPETDPLGLAQMPDVGAISVYARNKDYHDLIKKRLKQVARRIHGDLGAEVKVFVDTAPVMEKPLAERAGIGWLGKHSNLVSREFGAWLFIGVIATTLDITPDEPHQDRCGRCTKCIDACPTEAILPRRRIDARRCISYLTIENKGPIPFEFRKAIGNRIYGCDDCLAVCPWNRFAKQAHEANLIARKDLQVPELSFLVQFDDQQFRAFFSGSPIKRIGRNRFIRNVLIAIGNSNDVKYMDAVTHLLQDLDPLVRGAAVWAYAQIANNEDVLRIHAYMYSSEQDPHVRAEWDYAQICASKA